MMFAASLVGVELLESIVYQVMPSSMVYALVALFLLIVLIAGLLTPLMLETMTPAIAYAAVTLLWPLTPWESYDNLTYDSGWAGVLLLNIGAISFIIWLVAYVGYKLGKPSSDAP